MSEENFVFDIGRDALSVQNIQEKFSRVTSNIVNAVSSTFNQITSSNTPIIKRNYSCDDATDIKNNLDSLVAKSPIDEFQFEVPKDPYLSPYYATDDVLKQFPPVKILVRIKKVEKLISYLNRFYSFSVSCIGPVSR